MENKTQSKTYPKPKYDGFYNKVVKRIIGLLIAGIALLILWPFYLIIALAIAIEDGFPVIYRAQRGGYKGKTFRISKFRTMVKNADKIGGGTTALNDPRITKVGNILRKTKLDDSSDLAGLYRKDELCRPPSRADAICQSV